MQKKTRLEQLTNSQSQEDVKVMTDSEKIKMWIDYGQSVLLVGPSGIGKTQRLTDMYGDRVIFLKLTNNMLPEKVVGSTNMETGQDIPPNFVKQIILMCATEEEKKLINDNIQTIYDIADKIYERSSKDDEKIILLLDELLNVKPSVQSLVYSIVLNKRVEIGKGIKLPKNVVVVATGNPKKYSLSAEDLAEPLQKRFDHILNMEPKVSDWIYDYAIPNSLNPTVIGYILTKFNEAGRSDNLRDISYFYEEPEVGEDNLDKFGQRGKTNDPRSWESISMMLYNFEEQARQGYFEGKDIEDALKTSLKTKLRDEWAEEFFNFYNIPTLTVSDILTHNYTSDDLPKDIDQMFALTSSLLSAKNNELQVCRQFILNHCGGEYLAVFDMNWCGNDEDKMIFIEDLPELDYNYQVKVEKNGKSR